MNDKNETIDAHRRRTAQLEIENERLTKRVKEKDEHLVEIDKELTNTKALCVELDKELRETKQLIVAFITCGSEETKIDENGVREFKLFLDDRDIMNVADDDIFSVAYSDHRRGNVYTVSRKVVRL